MAPIWDAPFPRIRNGRRAPKLKALKVSFGRFQLREEALLCLKFAGVDAASPGLDADRMLEVKHLVIQQVFDGTARCIWPVEYPADDDGIVRGVVVAQHAARMVGAPCKGGAAEKPMEKAHVQSFEDLVEIVVMADGAKDSLTPSSLPNMFGLFRDRFGADVAAVAVCMHRRDGFLIELRQQNVGNSAVNALWRRFQKVGEANMETAFAQPDRSVERRKPAKADVERRNWSARTEVAVLFFKDGDECGEHCFSRLTRSLPLICTDDANRNTVSEECLSSHSSLLLQADEQRTRISGLQSVRSRLREGRGWLRARVYGRRCRPRHPAAI